MLLLQGEQKRNARQTAGIGICNTYITRSMRKMDYEFLFFAKQSLQYTGLSSEGWKGIFASQPHSAQVAVNISLGALVAAFLASLQALQRWGSFWKPLSA